MYARGVKDETLTFAVSGFLWNHSLVMIDVNTKSLWSHLYGKAMRGPLEGSELERLPSTLTDWETWRKLHPDTTVALLTRTSRDYRRDFYKDKDLDAFVLGATAGQSARAWPFDVLSRQRIVNDRLAEAPVLITYQPESSTAVLYKRVVGGRTLSFQRRDGELIDQETRSTWNMSSGEASAGPLRGSKLTPLPATVSYRDAWRVFYPASSYYEGE